MTGEPWQPRVGLQPEPHTPGSPMCGAETRPLGRRRNTFICSRDRHPADPWHMADDGHTVIALWVDGELPDVLGVDPAELRRRTWQ